MNRKWIVWGFSLTLLLALGWTFRDELDFIAEGLARLHHAQPLPLAVVVLCSMLSLLAMGEVMRLLMRAGQVAVSVREAAAITWASNAWSTTLPAGGAFSAVLTYYVQGTWGASVVLRGYFLAVSSIISSLWLAIIGLAGVFFLNANMAWASLVGTIVAMCAAFGGVWWLSEHPATVERWLTARRRWQGPKLDALIAHVRQLEEVHLSRGAFTVVTLSSLGHRLADLVSLWACVWAVSGHLPALHSGADATTFAGVALAYLSAKLAGSAQVTPGGVGTVEAALVATLVATGMTAVDATSAAIIYRLISFALMTAVGWVIYFWHYARRGISYSALNRKD